MSPVGIRPPPSRSTRNATLCALAVALSLASSASPADWSGYISSPIGPMIRHVTVTVHSRIFDPALLDVSRGDASTPTGRTDTPCLIVTGPKALTTVSTPRKLYNGFE